MTLYARADNRGKVFHVAPHTLSHYFGGWPRALCRFRPKSWGETTNDPQSAPVCGACAIASATPRRDR